MRRRKDPNAPKLLGLASAIGSNISRLEKAVAYQTVTRQVDIHVDELIACLLPPEDIETLRRAKHLVDDPYPVARAALDLPEHYPASFHIDLRNLDITRWRPDVARFQRDAPKAGVLLQTLKGLDLVHQRFVAVERLVTWFDQHASWGAVRYYWPSACALLPNDHDIHRMDGTVFREPKSPIGPMIPLCRETSMTIAEAMLCPHGVPATPIVSVHIGSSTFGLI
jgi:hypothetical protein